MIKHRFVCSDKEKIQYRIEQIIVNDLPCGKSIWGGNLYKAGIHFQESADKIKGFYLEESENESHRGSPIRVCFLGKFAEDAGTLYFDANIYPSIIEMLILIFAFCFLSIFGKIMGTIAATVVLSFFMKRYYEMIKNTYKQLNRIFN